MDHAVVQKWLRTVLGPYTDRDRVFADVDRALIAVSSLSPKTEVFTFNDGRTQLLLTLDGTIPVDFRNTTYNIPVAYWIPRDYPREPPMAFVAPTPDMAIRKGPNVDPSGEIGGEYLRRWRSKPEACNLLDLIHDCQHTFGREPPVYAKPKPTPVYATAAASSQQQRSQASTPQRQSSTSSTFAAQRHSGPPPVPASPQSPHVAGGGPSFQSPGAFDQRQKPPPPAPGTPSSSQEHAPHRPPKPASSLGPDGAGYAAAYSPGPRTSMSHAGQYGSPAREVQSPQQVGTPRFGTEDAYRRSSGQGLAPAGFGGHPQQHVALQYAPQSPQSPSHAAPWQQGAGASQRRDSQQLHPQYAQHAQHQQQRSHTSPYPTASDNHPGYNGSPAPGQPFPPPNGHAPYHQPQHASGAPQSQSQPPHPHAHPAGVALSNGANAYRDSAQQPAIAPKPKGINLLDDEDAHPAATLPAPTAHNAAVPPPPRPINPELLALHDRVHARLSTHLAHLSSTLSASNARLAVLSADLDRGLPAIDDEHARLKAVRDVCQTTGDRLHACVGEITRTVDALHAREQPDPDSLVLATSIVGGQLVDLVAEDNAIEDTLYHLGRALNAERIDLERFLKQTRMLAREQFMARALAMKIVDGMGWAE
ncbi:related to Tumor susceptibility gene 101 protein [Sporisorium reilianum SRZ2]|uniref:Related to Tumor susceptibility gene 101 protein n=1 Tax=Sporisorium reilianum (strain SRZ2) TaxID=999809 RepID=E7A158_SPORE|nr:related to Tumor susceptibility gene 101 protein [Sporisorium reilianum SRZ2]